MKTDFWYRFLQNRLAVAGSAIGLGNFLRFPAKAAANGGGAFMIAGMVLFVGMGQHIAQGSSLLSMVPAAAVGSWTHWRHGNVVTKILPGLAAGVLIGLLTVLTAAFAPARKAART